VLTFSSAGVERLISDLRNTKTFHRNRHTTKTLSALLRTKEGIENNESFVKFEASKNGGKEMCEEV
jgi:hypothetical protein